MFYQFKTALRNLRSNRLYSAINILGLSVSLTAVILIMLWVWDELSYDKFHKNAGDIYKVNALMYGDLWETTPPALAVHARAEEPGIVNACRTGIILSDFIEHNGTYYYRNECMAVDSSFFTMFDFPLVEGNSSRPFTDDESIILSQSKAKIIFGDKNPIGEMVQMADHGTFHVTGVMKDIPKNSSITADIIIPFGFQQRSNPDSPLENNWREYGYRTYIQLAKGADRDQITANMGEAVNRLLDPQNHVYAYSLQELTKLHLYSAEGKPTGLEKVRLFSIIAILVLIIACINYVNLVTARARKRNKEMSMRKLLGARRISLFGQLMNETVFLYVFALVISIGLIYLIIPFYNQLSGKEMEFHLFSLSGLVIFGGISLMVLALSGLYPAIFMASLRPGETMKTGNPGKSGSHGTLRKSLVVLQFVCSVVLITSTIVINKQLDYLRQKDLGYNKEQVFTMPRFWQERGYQSLKNELMKNPAILAVATADADDMSVERKRSGYNWPGKEEDYSFYNLYATTDFIETLGLDLIDGSIPHDGSKRYVLLNEEAVKQMQLDDPVGITINRIADFTIAGVIKDYNFENLNQKIKPLIIQCSSEVEDYLYIRTAANQSANAIAYVEKLWKEAKPGYEFTYHFLDDDFNRMYKTDIQEQKLFSIFAAIAILISCLGLFGLVTYTAETKTREIGIRKVLGASIAGVVEMLSKEFLILVGIAMLIAFPLAYYWLNGMLQDYAYHIDISWWMFALAGIITVALTLLTVGWKAVKAAMANPVKAIKTE